MNLHLFSKFQAALLAPLEPQVRDDRLLLDQLGPVQVFYAPFEHINPQSRVVLVGITPGPTQMLRANRQAREVLRAGGQAHEAIRLAKQVAAFSGEPMRGNLIKQLHHWGIDRWLGLNDAADLFAGAQQLLHTTSLLRYPVFVGGADYRGQPDMLRHGLLRRHLLEGFVAEVQVLPHAVFFGLGPTVQKVLDRLVAEGVLPASRVIGGMLHPSGNCTYRINYLVGPRSEPAPHATNPRPYDEGRQTFARRFLGA